MAELTPEQLAVFGPPNLAYLATINEDGSPHLSPLWADTRDGMIVLNTADGRVKVENVRRDPRVSVAIHDKEHPHPPIAVVGTAVDITTEGAAEPACDTSHGLRVRLAPRSRRRRAQSLLHGQNHGYRDGEPRHRPSHPSAWRLGIDERVAARMVVSPDSQHAHHRRRQRSAALALGPEPNSGASLSYATIQALDSNA